MVIDESMVIFIQIQNMYKCMAIIKQIHIYQLVLYMHCSICLYPKICVVICSFTSKFAQWTREKFWPNENDPITYTNIVVFLLLHSLYSNIFLGIFDAETTSTHNQMMQKISQKPFFSSYRSSLHYVALLLVTRCHRNSFTKQTNTKQTNTKQTNKK